MARRKKSKTPAATPPIQQNALTASPVALLIDGENVIAPDMIAHILVEAGKMGGVVIRQVYGNWATPSMHPWKEMTTHYALEHMGNVPPNAGRNAADIALVIGAMDLLYRGVRHFCLVAGDSDYVPLVLRLRQEGCTVLGIGMPNASHALKEACSRFLTTEQLMPQPAVPRSPKAAHPSPPSLPGTATPSLEELSTLLTDAYLQATQGGETEWILLALVGKALKDRNPTFQETYGKKKLSALIERYPDLFEQRLRTVGKGQTAEIRLREQKS
jgi:NYN domain